MQAGITTVAAEPARCIEPTRPIADRPVLNIAHRGASAGAPEHTAAAAALAHREGADYLELDVRMTRDGALIVIHDATIDRTARRNGSVPTGAVRAATLDELRRYDFGGWFNEAHPERANPAFAGLEVQTLEDVFRTWGRTWRYYIELKDADSSPGMEAELLRLMRAYGLRDGAVASRQVLIQSFSDASLRRMRDLDSELPLVQLLTEMGSDGVRARLGAIAEYAVAVGPVHRDVDPALVAAARDWSLAVHPYTVNEAHEMQRLIAAGVDGIFTDRPDRLRMLLQLRRPRARRTARVAPSRRRIACFVPSSPPRNVDRRRPHHFGGGSRRRSRARHVSSSRTTWSRR